MDRIKLADLTRWPRIRFTRELSARDMNIACPWTMDMTRGELCHVGTPGCQPVGWSQKAEFNPRWDEDGVASVAVMYEFTDGEKFWAHHNIPDSMCVEDFEVHELKTPGL